jgi:DNA polymerase III gamma/tau subunit
VRRAETDVFVEFCSWLAQAFRDLAALSAGAGPAAISAPDRAGDLAAVAARWPTAHWLQMAEAALGGQVAIRENAQPALAVEAVLLAPLAAQGQPLF